MINAINYTIYKNGEEHIITITPVSQNLPGSDLNSTGIFRLTEGEMSMGDIIFDDKMKQWEYTGMGNLNHQDAAEIAGFIQMKNTSAENNN